MLELGSILDNYTADIVVDSRRNLCSTCSSSYTIFGKHQTGGGKRLDWMPVINNGCLCSVPALSGRNVALLHCSPLVTLDSSPVVFTQNAVNGQIA